MFKRSGKNKLVNKPANKPGRKSGARPTNREPRTALDSTRENVARKAAENKSLQGASQAQGDFGEQLKFYYAHHYEVFVETWQRLWKTPVSTLLTWLLVGIALALPCGLYIALDNAETLRQGWQGSAQLSLYLNDSVSAGDGRKLAVKVAKHELVESTTYIAREQALEDFIQLSGMAEIADSLDGNPLPAVIAVQLKELADLPSRSMDLHNELAALAEVEEAQIDHQWMQRLHQIMQLGQRLTFALAMLLALAVVVVIGNTIRLSIENRREEILVVKLVGGTDAYVRRPFLYFGLLFGLGGGIACLLILMAIYFWVKPGFLALIASYGSDFALQGINPVDATLLLVLASVLGVLGAWVAVHRHLDQIEPS